MSDNMFMSTFHVDDGYIGNRPLHFYIDGCMLEDEDDEQSLREMFRGILQDEFTHRVFAVSKDEGKFVKWAKDVIKGRMDENI